MATGQRAEAEAELAKARLVIEAQATSSAGTVRCELDQQAHRVEGGRCPAILRTRCLINVDIFPFRW
jgi:hypothetical protein